jgi:hypothetical protein
MSAPVGVLHAIDQADTALGVAGLSDGNIFRAELREARDAVAELIEAANEAKNALRGSYEARHAAEINLRSALARVGA